MGKSSTSWKPGQSGNPKGRPPDPESISNGMRQVLAEAHGIGDGGETITNADYIARSIVDKAMGGEKWATLALLDRLEGKPRVTVDIDQQRDVDYTSEGMARRCDALLAEVQGVLGIEANSEPDANDN